MAVEFGKIRIDDERDKDGEVEVSMDAGANEVLEWINEEQAKAIISHLEKVFGINGE
jgi:hypothetical protein